MELQNPPQFTLEEVITLDFSDAGGGNPGASSPAEPTVNEAIKAKNEVTQEESPVSTNKSNSTPKDKKPANKSSSKLKLIN